MASSFRLGMVAASGLFVLVVGCVMGWYGFPAIMDAVIRKEMVLTTDSFSFDPWQEPTSQIDVYMQFIMFNVTNGDEFKTGGKPNVTEVGPFSYKETRERVDLQWSDDGDELTYNEVITYVFDEATSGEGLHEDTPINTLNAPMVVVAAMGNGMPDFFRNFLYGLVNKYSSGEPTATYKAGELLMSGANDSLLSYLADSAFKHLVPPTFADGKFRLYPYNNTKDGPYRIKTGKDDINQFTNILAYQNATSLSYWNTSYCNQINGTDGLTYPPNTGDVDRIFIFNKDLCRSIYLDYQADVEYFGIAGRRFSPIRAVLEDPRKNPDNRCFCYPADIPLDECLKAGVMSLSPCQYGAPIVASTPHFYNGEPEYWEAVNGLSPDQNRHETFIDVEPYTGLAMNGGKKIQINVQLNNYSIIGLEQVPSLLFPITYTNETAKIDQDSADQLNRQLEIPMKLMTAGQWILIGGGALMIIIALGLLLRKRSQITTV